MGYYDKAKSVPSVGPVVIAKYANAVFPDAPNTNQEAVPCFRAISPDDLPIVGEVETMKGLFLDTGHGTLGWTTGLATGDCLAQALMNRHQGWDSQNSFDLADGSKIDCRDLSPMRFVSGFPLTLTKLVYLYK